ncbi:MAG TPA: deoxyguanosinetriphosphate triphosphohydrolase [Myxococcota bacterium]|nr:deoxyguanosinetriphosphate triphosphohydrolase [Myxococcota bacterium]
MSDAPENTQRALRDRLAYEREERERLAPWAVASEASRGRVHAEAQHRHRTAFQRDRDRIVHSRAFRRLEYKTQVFVYHEGDHLRNRLTHTIEASQIARTIARALRLNEELAEAVVLAHDLGHTPFGHAGERVLANLMEDHGGFDHNRQSLRIVDWLEERYAAFRGLNLCYETREGILKHGCHWEHPVPVPAPTPQPCLEAQVADRADEIAYTNHDLDDGLRSGLIDLAALDDVPLWRDTHREMRERNPGASAAVLRALTIAALIDRLSTDLLEATAARLERAAPRDVDAVRARSPRFVGFRDETAASFLALKAWLRESLYYHPHVLAKNAQAEPVIGDLFHAYASGKRALPEPVQARGAVDGEMRAIADYVAGMTDRFALAEHAQLRGSK